MCFLLFCLWLYIDYIFFAIMKKFVASTWIVIWKSIGRYGVHSYCCRPFQNQLDHHMVSQQLQIITIYHFLLINKFNSTLENWWGGNFAAGTFQRLLWTNCVAVALTILRVTQWRKEGTAWWSFFQINNDAGNARFSRITLVQCLWTFGFIAAMIDVFTNIRG